MNWIYLAQNMVSWRADVVVITSHCVTSTTGDSLLALWKDGVPCSWMKVADHTHMHITH